MRRRCQSDAINTSVAGFASGLSFLVNSPEKWQFFILYILARALDISANELTAKGFVPEIPLGSVIMMSLMWPVMAYIYSCEPEIMNQGVRRFYYKFSKQKSHDQTIKWIFKCQMQRDLMRNPRCV